MACCYKWRDIKISFIHSFIFFHAIPPSFVTGCATCVPPSVGCDVENRLRHVTHRIRVSEFFKDYDPLASSPVSLLFHYCSYRRHRSVRPVSLIWQQRSVTNVKYGVVTDRFFSLCLLTLPTLLPTLILPALILPTQVHKSHFPYIGNLIYQLDAHTW